MSGWGIRTKVGGAVHYDSTLTDLGRFIASVETGISDGSWTAPEPFDGQVDFQMFPVGTTSAQLPQIATTANSISWTFPTGTGFARVNCFIVIWVV
ncbi:MAG: hypothetical protein QM605_02945 [Sphingobium sp.]